MPTKPRQFRLTDDTLAKIDALASEWGGTLKPLPRAAVITEAVNIAHRGKARQDKKRPRITAPTK